MTEPGRSSDLATRELSLAVPGLLGPFAEALPDLPARARGLEECLTRALAEPFAADAEALPWALFGIEQPAPGWPVAPVTWIGDGGDPGASWWMRADPVHLQVARERVILQGGEALRVSMPEAREFSEAFARTYADLGWRLEMPHPRRGYLRLAQDPGIRTQPLARVMGRDIGAFVPDGEQRQRWRALLTETQMLMHASPVNEAREARGEPPVNGLWFWGAGVKPDPAPVPWTAVWSDEPLGRGLATLAGVPMTVLPESAAQWLGVAAPGKHLAVVDTPYAQLSSGDAAAWKAAVEDLDQRWIRPLRAALRKGRLRGCTLYPGGGRRYTVTAARLRRFWRWPRPFAEFVSRGVAAP